MYVSGAVVAAMFPMVAEQYSQGKSTRALFVKSNLYGGGMAILCAVGMILLGKPIIGIFFGTRYMEAIDLLPAVCAFVIPVTFLTVISNYAVAVEQRDAVPRYHYADVCWNRHYTFNDYSNRYYLFDKM